MVRLGSKSNPNLCPDHRAPGAHSSPSLGWKKRLRGERWYLVTNLNSKFGSTGTRSFVVKPELRSVVADEPCLTNPTLLHTLPHKMIREETNINGELIQGTLEMLILKALARGPMHGYAVAEWVEQTSQQVLKVEEGALYPALHRLQLRGLLQAEWGASENNRRAKFYQLTPAGKKRLSSESQRWARLSAAVAFVMQTS